MTNDGHFKYADNFDILWNDVKNHFGESAMQFPSERCNECDLKENCIGGCPMFWEYYNPEDYILL